MYCMCIERRREGFGDESEELVLVLALRLQDGVFFWSGRNTYKLMYSR